jgi:hypothetical protein
MLLETNAPLANKALSSYVKVVLAVYESQKILRVFHTIGHFLT